MATDVVVCSPDSRSNLVSHFLPCRVCGTPASGFHYGVNTCEACKVFFMRSLTDQQKNACTKSQRCLIKPNRRTCGYCRYKRCLSIGMSKNAIKIGRYTIDKRCENEQELVKHNTRVNVDHRSNTLMDQIYGRMATYLSQASNLHDVYDTVTRDESVLHREQREFSDWHSACSTAIGGYKHLSDSEYEDFYNITGLNIDYRRDVISACVVLLKDGIEKQVKFAKTIPGFRKLSMMDQANIIRASACDFSRLCIARCLNDDFGVGTIYFGSSFALDDLTSIIDASYVRQSFALSRKLKKLKLHDEEIAVLKAVCITFTDRVTLEDKSAVDEIQWNLIGCLCWLLKRNHSNHERMFCQIWNCVLLLRELNERFNHHVESMLAQLPDGTDAPLLREFRVS